LLIGRLTPFLIKACVQQIVMKLWRAGAHEFPNTAMLKKITNHPIVSSVVAGVILAVLTSLHKLVPEFYPWIGKGIKNGWEWIWSSTLTPHWLLILLSGATLFLVVAILRGFVGRRPDREPHWTDYTKDDFFGVLWRWEYYQGSVFETFSYCPRCDTQFSPKPIRASQYNHTDKTEFQCDHCQNFKEIVHKSLKDIEIQVNKQISRKIRSEEYKDVVKAGWEKDNT